MDGRLCAYAGGGQGSEEKDKRREKRADKAEGTSQRNEESQSTTKHRDARHEHATQANERARASTDPLGHPLTLIPLLTSDPWTHISLLSQVSSTYLTHPSARVHVISHSNSHLPPPLPSPPPPYGFGRNSSGASDSTTHRLVCQCRESFAKSATDVL